MKRLQLTPLQKPIEKAIELPGSLSYTIRALMIASMTEGSVKIQNALKSDDTYAMLTILKTLGIKIEEEKKCFIVHGSVRDVKNKTYTLNVNISGRTARSILALLTIIPGVKTLICKEGFKKRPVGDLVNGLRQLGAKIEYLEKEGYLPVKVSSSKLIPGTAKMPGELSSQYFSGIMMIAPYVGEITIEVHGEQSSKPFIDITIDIMKKFGVEVINENYRRYHIKSNQNYKNPGEYIIEADAIAASYFWGIAALTKSKIKILHLSPNSAQGDIKFADLLGKMGCIVRKNYAEGWIEVEGTEKLLGITVNMNATPDSAVTLAVIATFAKGITKITGLGHIKIKETDRILGPKTEIQKMGITVESDDNSITIYGGTPQEAVIDTYGDHRMAMAFAIAGVKIAGITINNPEVVSKSFVNFWDKLKELGVTIKV